MIEVAIVGKGCQKLKCAWKGVAPCSSPVAKQASGILTNLGRLLQLVLGRGSYASAQVW